MLDPSDSWNHHKDNHNKDNKDSMFLGNESCKDDTCMIQRAITRIKPNMIIDGIFRFPRSKRILLKQVCLCVTHQNLGPDLKDPKPTTKCDDNKTADPWAEVLHYSNGEATDQLLVRRHKKLRSGPTLLRKSELCGLVKMATDI